jgi:hypothetical protein
MSTTLLAEHCHCLCRAARYLSGDDVLGLCAEVDFPPCLMMRRMLELLMRLSKQVGVGVGWGWRGGGGQQGGAAGRISVGDAAPSEPHGQQVSAARTAAEKGVAPAVVSRHGCLHAV